MAGFKDSSAPQDWKAWVWFLEAVQAYGQTQEKIWYLKYNLELN